MRKIIQRALIIGALVLGGFNVMAPGPAQAATAANAGVNQCTAGPSNAGSCTVAITEAGTYELRVVTSTGSHWNVFVSCKPNGGDIFFDGDGSETNTFSAGIGVCQFTFASPDDAATVTLRIA